jgi:hypothetical protein
VASLPDPLTSAQKHLKRLFWHRTAPWLGGEHGLMAALSRLFSEIDQEAYSWGVENVVGIAVRRSSLPIARVDVFLADRPAPGFRSLLEKTFPLVSFRLVVTGHWRFAAGIASAISLPDQPGGRIACFLKDGAGSQYALTCAHVLDADPANQDVLSDTVKIGKLAFRQKFIPGLNNPTATDPDEPNEVDCALDRPVSAAPGNLIPTLALPVAGIASPQVDKPVQIVRSDSLKSGVVKSNKIDLWFPYDSGRVYFNDLTVITGDHGIQPGDSGSLAISEDRHAVGIAIGYALNGFTDDKPPTALGPIGILCDLGKIQQTLSSLVGSPLTLA